MSVRIASLALIATLAAAVVGGCATDADPAGTTASTTRSTTARSAGEPAMPSDVDGPFRLDHVVDGDTVRVFDERGESQSVRLIGIDTPETKDPRSPVECFGREASREAERFVTSELWLETDATQGDTDRYGRLLAYVWTSEGRMLNWHMVEDGFAHEYTYDLPYRYQAEFQAAERTASTAERGLWSPETCAGEG